MAPVTVEKLRAASRERDAVLIAVLAHAGLRPQEALALYWGHVRDRTILVERAVSPGEAEGHQDPGASHGATAGAAAGGSAGLAAVAWAAVRRRAGVPVGARPAVDEDRLGQLAAPCVRSRLHSDRAV